MFANLKQWEPVAKKEHRCMFCGCRIPVGVRYHRETNVMDGEVYDFVAHKECIELSHVLDMYEYADEYGISEETFYEYLQYYIDANHRDDDDWQNISLFEIVLKILAENVKPKDERVMEENKNGKIEGNAKITFGVDVSYKSFMPEDKKSVKFGIFEKGKPTQVELVFEDVRTLGFFRHFISARYKEMLDEQKRKGENRDSYERIAEWIAEAKATMEWPMTRKDIKKKVFGGIGRQKNETMQQNDLEFALKEHLLKETTIKSKGNNMLMYCNVEKC